MKIILSTNLSTDLYSLKEEDVDSLDENIQVPKKIFSPKKYLDNTQKFKKSPEEVDLDKAYDVFSKSYLQSTGKKWEKDKFIDRAKNWIFYGDEDGYITVRPQNSGMLKLVGMAGNPKSILRGFQALNNENKPIWGMVSSDIKDMAIKGGYKSPPGWFVKFLISFVPKNVFGGAEIKGTDWSGGVTFSYKDIGETTKFLIGNSNYYKTLLSSPLILEKAKSLPNYVVFKILNVLNKLAI